MAGITEMAEPSANVSALDTSALPITNSHNGKAVSSSAEKPAHYFFDVLVMNVM